MGKNSHGNGLREKTVIICGESVILRIQTTTQITAMISLSSGFSALAANGDDLLEDVKEHCINSVLEWAEELDLLSTKESSLNAECVGEYRVSVSASSD